MGACVSSSDGTSPHKSLFKGPEYELKGEWAESDRAIFDGVSKMNSAESQKNMTKEVVLGMRQGANGAYPMMHPDDQEQRDKCDTQKITINGADWGSTWDEITIFVHTPKDVDTHGRGCVWFHGSAFCMFSAEICQGEACQFAAATKTTVFNVDYRKTPEHTAKEMQLDCWAGLKYVLSCLQEPAFRPEGSPNH